MSDATVTAWTGEDLPALVRFWNRTFADRRNFFPLTEALFRERVLGKETAVERFEPATFLVAREGGEIVGVLHGGVRPEKLCRTLHPDWPGGEQAYVALFEVERDHRRKGVGSELWRRFHDVAGEGKQLVLDGQCINPFYGNSEGPFTPFWGTPEGISVSWEDSATKKFLARKGFAPRFKAVQMELDIRGAKYEGLVPPDFELKIVDDYYPELGITYGVSERYTGGGDFACAVVLSHGKTVAVLSWFSLKQIDPRRYAIYEAIVSEEYQGMGLGRALLAAAIGWFKKQKASTCDVLTLPEISRPAFELYSGAGFQPCANWAIY
jgi:ribosomal protein S18 acetylase RimI-like enzyme